MNTAITDIHQDLMRHVADEIHSVLKSADGSVRMRFDGFTVEEAYAIIPELSSTFSDLGRNGTVAVLSDTDIREGGIDVDRAIELRNLEGSSLALLVPLGKASGESSLRNTFKSYSYQNLIELVSDRLFSEFTSEYPHESISILLRELLASPKIKKNQDWAEFLISVRAQPSDAGIGLNLWRIGLIPDVGPGIGNRLKRNIETCRKLMAPPGPASTISSRISSLGLREYKLAWQIQEMLSGVDMTQDTIWTKKILDQGLGILTFEQWDQLDNSTVAIKELHVTNFVDGKGNIRKYNRLAKIEGSEILACVLVADASGDMIGKVGVEWSTAPAKDIGVHEWLIEVVQPSYIRQQEPEVNVLGSAKVSGASRKALVSVSTTEDEYVAGSRYVFRISGQDKSGQTLSFYSESNEFAERNDCIAESDEFQLGEQEAGVETPSGREASVASIALAELEEARQGASDHQISISSTIVDELNGIAEATASSGRKYTVRFSPLLAKIQKSLISDKSKIYFLSGEADELARIDIDHLQKNYLENVPQAFLSSRKKFLKLLEENSPTDWPSVELANWTEELIESAKSYSASYRRALDSAENSAKNELLSVETINLEIRTAEGLEISVTIAMPTHPLRALWWSQYAESISTACNATKSMSPKIRQTLSPLNMSESSPANYPFAQKLNKSDVGLYIGELTLGTGLYASPELHNSTEMVRLVQRIFGIPKSKVGIHENSKALVSRLQDFVKLHGGREGLSLKFVNDRNGNLANGVMRTYLAPKLEEPAGTFNLVPQRVEIYSPENLFSKPSEDLISLQREYSELSFRGKPNFLVPPLSLAMQSVSDIGDSTNYSDISVITNYEQSEFVYQEIHSSSLPLLDGLQTRVEVLDSNEPLSVLLAPSIGTTKNNKNAHLSQTHHSFLKAIANPDSKGENLPALKVSISDKNVELLRELHGKSEWVVSLEQHAGVHLFEQVLKTSNLRDVFILDYSVEGVDTSQDRITVTSTDRAAVEASITGAMQDLNLSAAGFSSGNILRTLSHISGRLALRLRENNNRAKEIVGLAAVVMHLRLGGKLSDTILIPVDEHPEIFHPSRRGPKRSGRRCDLMLVRISKTGNLSIELIEVKFRSAAEAGSQILFEDICDQLITTRQFIKTEVLSSQNQRADENWQWSRFCNLLHFYTEKGRSSGDISPEATVSIKSLIDKAYERREQPIYSASGYIVATNATVDLQDRDNNGVVVKFLAANLLNNIGQTTTSFGPEMGATIKVS